MRLFRMAGYLVASALMLASPAAVAAPVFDKDTEFIVQNPEQRLDLATSQNISIAEAPAFRDRDFTRSLVGVAASQNIQAPAAMIVEHAAALPPFDPG